jgi:hypothetical protein
MMRCGALACVALLAIGISSVAAAATPTRMVFSGDEENPQSLKPLSNLEALASLPHSAREDRTALP